MRSCYQKSHWGWEIPFLDNEIAVIHGCCGKRGYFRGVASKRFYALINNPTYCTDEQNNVDSKFKEKYIKSGKIVGIIKKKTVEERIGVWVDQKTLKCI